jgi:hypothetical protein
MLKNPAIQAPMVPPTIHPRDKHLLRPLKSLGKPKNEVADVSFLRRTQYVAEDRTSRGVVDRQSTGQIKRRRLDAQKEDPTHILRSVIKGFDIANPGTSNISADENGVKGLPATPAENDAWRRPKHPTKPHLKMLDSYPLLPDLDGLTMDQQGGYSILKFIGNPTSVIDQHDERLETSLLRQLDMDPNIISDYSQRMAEHKANPERVPEPALPELHFELFLPKDNMSAWNLKRHRDIDDEDKDSPSLFTASTNDDGEKDCFQLTFTRQYETGVQQSHTEAPYQEVALALHDPEMEGDPTHGRLQKAAYFYPITSKAQIRPRRVAQLARLGLASQTQDQDDKIDAINLTFRDAAEEDREVRDQVLAELESKNVETEV